MTDIYYMNEMNEAWQEYLEALGKCVVAVKLTAFHTREAAIQANIAADQTLLTVYHGNLYRNEARNVKIILS